MKKVIMFLCVSLFVLTSVNAQVFYVDLKKGDDMNTGNKGEPFKSIQKAVEKANKLTGTGSITIKLRPGLYVLHDKVDINPVRIFDENSKFIIESEVSPGDSIWKPHKMPVIASMSANNSDTQFKHSTGFLVSSNHTEFKGIKFYGNSNPYVAFYYPISRENPKLEGLKVSQCMFVGAKNSGVIQGGIWAHGADINIDHNVFYQCRNAILLFQEIDNSIISNNIIYDAYESAFWMGNDDNLKFENNIVSNCNYFWVGDPKCEIEFSISNSIISDCKHFVGNWGNKGVTESNKKFMEHNINKEDKIFLIGPEGYTFPQAHLHLKPESIGDDLNAGIFK
ncbi:MAG: right-handed parallel beta-helix repeat-containing protein [Bacteroidetes bacterium]|nr:right-handed parallel beta-helix repeat-containing protein [Bacteroidota bacterium]